MEVVQIFVEIIGVSYVLEGHSHKLLAGVARDFAELVVDPQPPAVRIHMRYADGRLLERGAETLLTLPKGFLSPPAPESGAQSAGGGLERVHLDREPLTFGQALVEAYETPPLTFDEDRYDQYREDVLGLKLGPFALREVSRVAVHQISLAQ